MFNRHVSITLSLNSTAPKRRKLNLDGYVVICDGMSTAWRFKIQLSVFYLG